MTTLHHTHSRCDQQRLGAPPPPRLQPRLPRGPPLRAARSVTALTGDAPPPKRGTVNGSLANHHHQQRGPPPRQPPRSVSGLVGGLTTNRQLPIIARCQTPGSLLRRKPGSPLKTNQDSGRSDANHATISCPFAK